jgi:hypothetical protein
VKLSLFSASALLVVALTSGCSSSPSGENPPGPLVFNADLGSGGGGGSEVFLEGRTEGERVILNIVAKGVKEVHGTAFRVKWDPEALGFVSAAPSDAWSTSAILVSKEALPGTLVVAWAEKGEAVGHDATEPLVLGTLTFDAKGRKGSAVSFRTERSEIVDHEGKSQTVSWRAGNVPAR